MFLTLPEWTELDACVRRLGRHMQLLRSIAETQNMPHWHMPPKTHYGQHWPEQCMLINSRYVQTYGFESFIGVLTKIWESACNGPFSNGQQFTVCVKFLVLFILVNDL